MHNKRKIGILGYGSVGKFLYRKISEEPDLQKQLEVVFIWNRSPVEFTPLHQHKHSIFYTGANPKIQFEKFLEQGGTKPDTMVEVCHPSVIKAYGNFFLTHMHLFVSSLTSLINPAFLKELKQSAQKHQKTIYLPVGAAWGVHDIVKMGKTHAIQSLSITMTFHADALKLEDPLKEKLSEYQNNKLKKTSILLFEGKIKALAPLAPNNVNTMVCLALASGENGLEHTHCKLLAQKETDAHTVEIEVKGKSGLMVKTQRINPAKKGAVTGKATYYSFLASLLEARENNSKLIFC